MKIKMIKQILLKKLIFDKKTSNIFKRTMRKIIKDTIYANVIEIYTQDIG